MIMVNIMITSCHIYMKRSVQLPCDLFFVLLRFNYSEVPIFLPSTCLHGTFLAIKCRDLINQGEEAPLKIRKLRVSNVK